MNYGDDEIDLKKRPTDQGFYLLTYLRDSQSRHQYLLPPSAPSWRNFAASMVVAARERWQDERVFGANREPTHVPLRAYEDVAAAHAAQVLNGDAPPASRWVKPLTPSAERRRYRTRTTGRFGYRTWPGRLYCPTPPRWIGTQVLRNLRPPDSDRFPGSGPSKMEA